MLNREVNALSMISKRPYTSSGWRVLKSRPAGGSGNFPTVDTSGTASSKRIRLDNPRADLIGGVPENASFNFG